MRTLEDFLTFFRRQRSWTRTLVAAVPEDCFGWRPADNAFSCGELVRHLIQSEGFWVKMIHEAIEGRDFDPFGLTGDGTQRMTTFRPSNLELAMKAVKRGTTFAECLADWVPLQEQTEAALAGLTPEQLEAVQVEHPVMALRMPLWESLLTMVGHEVYHRGQLSAYLKMIGVEQPAFLG